MWDGEFCGSIGVRWQPGTEELPPHVLGHVGYSVVPWKRRLGFATAAVRAILPDAAAEGLRWIEVTTDVDNVASQGVIERAGGVLVERFAYPPPTARATACATASMHRLGSDTKRVHAGVEEVGRGAPGVEAALFESGEGTPLGSFDHAADEARLGVADLLHRLRVVGDVGREVELPPTGSETVDEGRDHVGRDHATVVVASLRPRVGKVDADDRERLGRDAVEERQQVAVHDPDVVEPAVLDRVEHGDHAGRVHLDADHVDVRLGRRHLDRRLAVAEADVEHDVAVASEHLGDQSSSGPSRSRPHRSIHSSNSAWRFGDNERGAP
jgi:hypothetical protein